MSAFKDSEGRDWKLRLNYGIVSDVKHETGVNLALVSKDTSWVDALFSGDGKLASVLWVLCEGQAAARDVTPEQFPYLLDGEVLEAAGAALADAIADFFPRSAVAKALKKRLPEVMAAADRKAIAELDRAVATLTDSPSAASGLASVESIPAG